MRILLALGLWFMAEIAAYVVVGGWIGVAGVLALVLGSGVVGVVMLRRMGLQAVQQLRGQVRGSGVQLAQSGMTALGAVLLVQPGLIGGVMGLVLMLPPVQRGITAWFARRVHVVQPQDDVVEGTAVEIEAVRLDHEAPPSGWTKP